MRTLKAHLLKGLAVARLEISQMAEFKLDFYVFWFQSFLRGTLMVAFWWVYMGSQEGSPTGELDREAFILLFVSTQIFLLPFHGSEAIASMVEAPVIEGRMALVLCRPIHPLLINLSRVTCQQCRTMVVALILWVLADHFLLPALLGTAPVFAISRLPLLLLSMILGSLVNNLLYTLIGLFSFWVGHVWSLLYVSGIFSGALSGQFFPLHINSGLEFWSRFLPFRSIAYSPALVATGKAGWNEILLQATMAAILAFLVIRTFNKGVRSFESAGG